MYFVQRPDDLLAGDERSSSSRNERTGYRSPAEASFAIKPAHIG